MTYSTAAKEFNESAQPAQRQDPAVFDFEAEVAQAWRDFPEIKNRVFFFDASADAKLVYPADDLKDIQPMRMAMIQNVRERLSLVFASTGKNSYCTSDISGTDFILLLTEKHSHDVVDKAAPVAQETTFVFDHELAHAAIPNASYIDAGRNRAESIADAYAVIRHFQRYGADSPVIEALVANRAFDLVFRQSGYGHDHFTSPVVEKILACRHEVDWDSFTPEQTAGKAKQFVLAYEMNAEALRILDRDFGALHDTAKDIEKGDAAPLQALAEKVLATDSSAIFKYGTAALTLCIDQPTAGVILKGGYWDAVRQKLAQKQRALAQPKPQPVKPPRGP